MYREREREKEWETETETERQRQKYIEREGGKRERGRDSHYLCLYNTTHTQHSHMSMCV